MNSVQETRQTQNSDKSYLAMHLETLLYMLLQSDRTRPPPGVAPDFEALARQAAIQSVPNKWFRVPGQRISLGLHDPENDLGPVRYYGWDNEKPRRQVNVPAFEAKARPITNEDYARYLEQTQKDSLPASWKPISAGMERSFSNSTESKQVNGGNEYMNGHSERLTDSYLRGKAVKTVYGLVPLEFALDWPVMASYDEVAGCAKWMNGRIPTAEEARSIYSFVDRLKRDESGNVDGRTISAVNGYISRCDCNLFRCSYVDIDILSTMVSRSPRHHTFLIRAFLIPSNL